MRDGRAAPIDQLTLDLKLLKEARGLGVNVARAAERGVAAAERAARARAWRAENAEALPGFNAFVKARGVPLARYRKD